MSNPIPSVDLEKLEKLAREATPGPWRTDSIDGTAVYLPYLVGERSSLVAVADHNFRITFLQQKANASYISAANPQAVLQLISIVKRLAEALGWFLNDERFQVAVGGNPIAVDKMLADARARLTSTGLSDRGNGGALHSAKEGDEHHA